MTRSIILILSTLAWTTSVFGQFEAYFSDQIPVLREGAELANPWSGGINAGQVSTIDANLDGLEDVFIFDRSGNKPIVFLNNGSGDPNTFNYSYNHSWAFPDLRNWALLRDYNCDGKQDIFTYNGIGGFRIFENVSTPDNSPQFVEVEPNLQSLYAFENQSYISNIFISSVDIPGIDDLDGDGDLDIMVYSVSGVLMEYHLNQSMEQTGTCDSLIYALANRCYGYFSESAFDNSITLHDAATHVSLCPPGYNVADPSAVAAKPDDIEHYQTTGGTARHAGTTILPIELTGGLPKEIVLGDVGNTNLVALINSVAESGLDSIVDQNVAFPAFFSTTDSVDVKSFPAGYYEDMNNDGARDLIVCPNNEWASINDASVWYYENNGQDDEPDFALVQKDLFQSEMIDVGEGVVAVFFDHNSDGLLDLVVGNKGRFIGLGEYASALALYENTGSLEAPEFTHITDDYAEIGSLALGQGLHPAFGDLDGDGDEDMLIGTSSGTVYAFDNTAGVGSTANFAIASEPILPDNNGDPIDPGQFSTPQLFDLDGDALLDLLMGERNGRIHYYKNTGTPTDPEFTLVNDFLGGVETIDGFSSTGYSTVCFFEHGGETRLMTGAESGKVALYNDIDDNLDGDFSPLSTELFGHPFGIRSSATVVDINGDGNLDAFVGNYGGGIHYMNGGPPTAISELSSSPAQLVIYPNPASDQLFVQPRSGSWAAPQLEVIDLTGRRVLLTSFDAGQAVSMGHLARGIFLVRVFDNHVLQGQKKVILK